MKIHSVLVVERHDDYSVLKVEVNCTVYTHVREGREAPCVEGGTSDPNFAIDLHEALDEQFGDVIESELARILE